MSEIRKEINKLNEILDGSMDKRVLLTLHQQVTTRIFDEGKDANESQIGEYSRPYIKTRVKKGLGGSPKVILEFTGQMRNDFLLLEEGDDFASGFTNTANGDKSYWVEDTYNKEIFKLSNNEEQLLENLYNVELKRTLNG